MKAYTNFAKSLIIENLVLLSALIHNFSSSAYHINTN